jgi:hypothetical protein
MVEEGWMVHAHALVGKSYRFRQRMHQDVEEG